MVVAREAMEVAQEDTASKAARAGEASRVDLREAGEDTVTAAEAAGEANRQISVTTTVRATEVARPAVKAVTRATGLLPTAVSVMLVSDDAPPQHIQLSSDHNEHNLSQVISLVLSP